MEDDSDDESDTSNESIYIQMSVAKGSSLISGSASQNDDNDNDFDILDNWTHSEQFECPLHDNPSYISVETVMNS